MPSLVVGLLIRSTASATAPARLEDLQATVAPPPAGFPTPFGGPAPTAVALPTVGPGQTFTQDSPNRPETVTVEGDEQFGYGRLAGSTDLLLAWFTDDSGTHYLVVDETDEDQAAILDDFKGSIAEREGLQNDIENKELAIQEAANKGRRNEAFTLGIAVAGGICGVITGGLCIPFALGAAAAYGLAWDQYFSQERAVGERDILAGELAEAEHNLAGDYSLLESTGN